MKRTAIDHPKVKRLASLLDVPHYSAVGVLECLWHFTARHAICGNVGKWSNEEIAEAIGWPAADAERLISALGEARLLDRHEKHRLTIHDWNDHADESTRKTLQKKDMGYANREPGNLPWLAESNGKSVDSGTALDQSRTIPEQNRQPKPKPEPKPEPSPSRPKFRFDEADMAVAHWIFDRILELQPDRAKPNFEQWANTIRLLRERDTRSHDEIRELFDWANRDSFWQTVVLCPEKLREKWDDLRLKLKLDRNEHRQQRLEGIDARSSNPARVH